MEEINLDEQNIQQQRQQLHIEIETLKDEIECCFDFLQLFVPKQFENKLKNSSPIAKIIFPILDGFPFEVISIIPVNKM